MPDQLFASATRWGRGALAVMVLLLGATPLQAAPGAALAEAGQAAGDEQTTPGITLSARAGFDGYYKDGLWAPVRVSIANDGPDAHGTLSIASPRNDGTEILFMREVQLPTQSRREFFFYIAPEGYVNVIKITLRDGKTQLATASLRIALVGPTDLLYGVLAGSPSAFGFLSDVDPVSGAAQVAQLTVEDLPPVGQAWQALDALVVSDVDTGALSPEQRAALAGWVANGGRLIVAGGPTWQKTAAGLNDLLPLIPSAAQTLNNMSDLGAYSLAAPPQGLAVAAAGTLATDAVVFSKLGTLPFVVSRHSGFGQITYLSVDPAFAPLKGWDGLADLFRSIIALPSERPSWAGGFRSNWSSANDAVNAVPGLDLPSAWQMCGFLVVYLIVIGPLNYMVLKRMKRRELAWVTIPAIVLVFSAGAYLSGYQLRGATATLHRLAAVQVWPDSDRAQVDGLVGLFSPRRAEYDLEFGPGFLVRPIPYTSAPSMLQQGDLTRIPGVRSEVGQVQGFVAQGQIPAPSFESALTLAALNGSLVLEGTVTNQSDLTLSDVVLLAPGGVLRLDEFAPGETEQVSVPLLSGRASPSVVNSNAPVLPLGLGVKPPPYYSGGAYDSTIDDILGNSNYYSDKQAFRRYSLLSALLNSGGGTARGGGVYLVGWSSVAPVPAQVVNRAFTALDSTVYFITLRPRLNLGQGRLTLPPGVMTWTLVDPGQMSSAGPYDQYLYPGYWFSLRFAPTQYLPFRSVSSLTLHLADYGATGSATPQISLWDFTENTWVLQYGLSWGDNVITTPGRFVSPAGEIQVRVENPAAGRDVNLEAVDFTLVIEQ